MITTEKTENIIESIADKIEENKKYLTDLDAKIGDGDHGINMSKGFKYVKKSLQNGKNKNAADVLKKTGIALVSHVGGASGALYGTAFMKSSGVVSGKENLNIDDFINILKACVDGIKMRGKAELGEKTMLDSLIPAYEAAKSAGEKGVEAVEVLRAAADAAEEGAAHTEKIAATKGRASYLGDRSIGHRDPGAASTAVILNTIYEFLK